MDSAILIGFGVGAIILYMFGRGSTDHKKTTKFTIPPFQDKQTQTDVESPMSLSEVSMDFPFSFKEDYLNSNNELKCEKEIDGLTGLCEIPDIMIECESGQ